MPSLGAYQDIIAILDTILRHGQYPAQYHCSSPAEAHTLRHRANGLRVWLRRMEEKNQRLPAGQGTSIYDQLVFSIEEGSPTIIITQRKLHGHLVIGGEEIEPVSDDFLEDVPAVQLGDLGDDEEIV